MKSKVEMIDCSKRFKQKRKTFDLVYRLSQKFPLAENSPLKHFFARAKISEIFIERFK
jgi:hypothetical protein